MHNAVQQAYDPVTTAKANVQSSLEVSRTLVVTFNGTQHVTLTVGDKVFDLDLKLRRRAARP